MLRNAFKRQDSHTGAAGASKSPSTDGEYELDDKNEIIDGAAVNTLANQREKFSDPAVASVDDLDEKDLIAPGKERPIESAADIATRCLSLDDDPTMPIHTVRMYVLGLGLTCFAAVLGQIFYFRPSGLSVSSLFLQVASFILGRLWHAILPKAHRGKFWAFLNPCQFNLKEHVAITIMTSTATTSAQAISVYATDDLYYNFTPNWGVAIFTLMASQLMGYGIAGLFRAICVQPTYVVFPQIVPVVQLFDMLHRDQDVSAQKKRLKFFLIVFFAIFFWEWIPEYIAPTLTGFSIFCLARRNSTWVSYLFGGAYSNEGMGLFSICLDWSYISGTGVLYTPLQSTLSIYGGVCLGIIITCAMYTQNVWSAQTFPFFSQSLFLENGSLYDQTIILNADSSLNDTALAEYGLPWMAPSWGLYYLGCNLAVGATITHVICWYSPQLIAAWKSWRNDERPDPHYEKMRVYKEVPMWAYGLIVLGSFAMAMATCYTGDSHLPWWALIVAIIFTFIFFPLVTLFYSITGCVVDTSTLAQMFGAAVVPGNSQANMFFTLYSSDSVTQAMNMAVDLKLAQYTKIPPWTTLGMQILGTVVGAILQLVIMYQIIDAHRDILLSVEGTNIWSGANVQSFNTQAITWGAMAKHMYGPSSKYLVIPLGVIIGLACPLPFYFLHRIWPRVGFNLVATPLALYGIGYLNSGINSEHFVAIILAFFSQWYLRKYRPTWFRKKLYILSAALDGGMDWFVFIFTFAVAGAGGKTTYFPTWALNPAGINADYCATTFTE